MRIVTAFKTSKGVFLDPIDAHKKCNRAKITEGSHNDYWQSREPVIEVFLLEDDGKYFTLNKVEVTKC